MPVKAVCLAVYFLPACLTHGACLRYTRNALQVHAAEGLRGCAGNASGEAAAGWGLGGPW